ncbi:MAG: purine-nucleoside phosphorylase [Halioglobus sp.]
MSVSLDQIKEAAGYIASRAEISPRVGIILGSGLGDVVDAITDSVAIPYSDIPHFPTSGAPSHKGLFHIGYYGGVAVVIMQGRVHLYEGYSPAQVTFPIRVMKELGVESLIVTNAAGGINKHYDVGDLMLLEDHINIPALAGMDPTRGESVEELGPRFTPMNQTYDPNFLQAFEQVASEQSITLRRGVYAHVVGPCFETPAEIRFLNLIGADAVGMSTIPEVMVARNAGIRVLAVSAITNLAIHDSNSTATTTEEEVWESVKIIMPKISLLLQKFVEKIG